MIRCDKTALADWSLLGCGCPTSISPTSRVTNFTQRYGHTFTGLRSYLRAPHGHTHGYTHVYTLEHPHICAYSSEHGKMQHGALGSHRTTLLMTLRSTTTDIITNAIPMQLDLQFLLRKLTTFGSSEVCSDKDQLLRSRHADMISSVTLHRHPSRLHLSLLSMHKWFVSIAWLT